MLRMLLSITLYAVIASVVLPSSAWAAPGEIAVTGYGVATAKPDYATIDVSLSVMRDKAEEATQAAAAIYDSLVSVLGSRGIGEDDYSTMQYQVSAEWERDDRGNRKKFRGFVARHLLRVRVRDLRAIGQIVDASAGVGMTQITEVRFYSSKSDSLSKAALAEAAQDALERAEIMANALGGNLGSLIELATESAARIGGRRDPGEEERVQAVALKGGIIRMAPQEIMMKATVVGRWEFKGAQ